MASQGPTSDPMEQGLSPGDEGVWQEDAAEMEARPSAETHTGIDDTQGAPLAGAIVEPRPGTEDEAGPSNDGLDSQARQGSQGADAGVEDGSAPQLDQPDVPQPDPEHNLMQALREIQSNPLMGPGMSSLLWLRGIRIEGADKLRPNFLLAVLRPYLDRKASVLPWASWLYGERLTHVRPGQPASVRDLQELTESISMDLNAFDIFRAIHARLEPSSVPGAGKEDVEIVLDCESKGRYFLKTSTDLGNNGDKSVSVQGHARNIFGGAEFLEASATWGTKTRRAFNVLLATPLLGSPVFRASLAASTVDRDCTAWSSVWEAVRGIRSAITFTGNPGTIQELAAEISHRHVGYPTALASPAMRALMGDTVKASLTHSWTRDTSDDPLLPTEGWSGRLVQELAGAGGSTSHLKLEGEAKIARALDAIRPGWPEAWGVSLSGAAGLLRTFNGRPSCFSDRYHLGGSTSVRMLRQNAMGPKALNTYVPDTPEHGDSLGGDAYWSLGASVFAPFFKREWGDFKWHGFVNAGQLALMNQRKPLLSLASGETRPTGALTDLWNQLSLPTVTAGVGLVYTQGALRAELNAGAPIASRRSDGTRKGLQLGVGISFM